MLLHRPRRNRKSQAVRALVQEHRVYVTDLIYPLFLIEGTSLKVPVNTLPGINRLSIDLALKEVERAFSLGIHAFALFPVIPSEKKDDIGTEALNPKGVLQKGVLAIKKAFPQVCLITDVALDPYTSHGHDGILDDYGDVDNDKTVEILSKMAVMQASVGVDMVAPSDMMDGRVGAIRLALDSQGFSHVGIHAYSVKYASAFYGPYRDALSSRLQFGNKKTYQLNPANSREALWEAFLDEKEGADILMVKPALCYLDIISKLKESTSLPISAFHVSGEYAMVMAAAQNGWIDGKQALIEIMLSLKRAGADMIFTYAAPQLAEWINSGALD